MNLSPIPDRPFPGQPAGLSESAEPLVDLAETIFGVLDVTMMYHRQGVPGAISRCFLRAKAAHRLQKALSMLPEGYGLRIYDAWRPIAVQQALFDAYAEKVRRETAGQGLTEEQLLERIKRFVSIPSYDIRHPSVHNTGGAVDLTLIGPDGRELDMGTAFDDFTPAAYTTAFEASGSREVRDNRRLLYTCMTTAGFTNLPTEWWHYDYGTAFWSYYTGQPALYTGLLNGGEYNEKGQK